MKYTDSAKNNFLAPKPVRATGIQNHGLLGATFVHQHMLIDERWTVGSLIEEYSEMTNLLSKRLLFKNLETKAHRKYLQKKARDLRTQCRNGRILLHRIIYGNNVNVIRNYLINHKHLQRLYQKMPAQLVVENINQRTFVMRKERDRLTHSLNLLKEKYRLKLLERAHVENHIKYANAFMLDEQKQIFILMKEVENSHVRLKAFKTINSTYKKIVQVLRHDETFYEPILKSLNKDIDDQTNFIKHILYLGMPAISIFKHLNDEFLRYDKRSRKSAQHKIQTISVYRKVAPKATPTRTARERVVNMSKRYKRETKSMLKLKNNLEQVEAATKQIKMATLTSHAKEIFPRFKSQVESNFKLIKENDIGHMELDFLVFREKVAGEMASVLVHNYSKEEEKRLERINELKKLIKAEDVVEENILAYLKNRTDAFVVFRYACWNLFDILKYVGDTDKFVKVKYPNQYLKLPLLKFEMMTMRACPPEGFEDDVYSLISSIERKLRIIMRAYNKFTRQLDPEMTEPNKLTGRSGLWEEYHETLLGVMEPDEVPDEIEEKPLPVADEELYETKTTQIVPSRKLIKTQSAKLVEEILKRDD